MEKLRFLLAFMLVALIFSSCAEKNSDYETKVEFIEHSYIVLRPHDITKDSPENPRDIYLTIRSLQNGDVQMNADWYKKTNGVYQLFSLNDTGRKLNPDLVYEIIDTVNLSNNIIKYRNNNTDLIDKAYQGDTILLEKIVKRKHLEEYLWTKMEVMSKDSLLQYDAKTKSFVTTTTYPVTKLKTDFGPIIIFLICFLLTISIAFRDRIKWLKKLREKIFRYDFLEISGNDHQLNSLILFIVFTIFNFIYGWWLTGNDAAAALIFGILTGFLARLIFWLDKIKFKLIEKYNFGVPFSIMIISVIYALEACFSGMPEKFCYATSMIIVLPAMLDVILFEIEQKKLKNSKGKKVWYEKTEK